MTERLALFTTLGPGDVVGARRLGAAGRLFEDRRS